MLLSTPSLTCICPCCSALYSQAAEAAELATRVQAEAANMARQQAEELRLKAEEAAVQTEGLRVCKQQLVAKEVSRGRPAFCLSKCCAVCV